MNDASRDEFQILHGLRIQGMTNAQRLSGSTGYPEQGVQRLLGDAVAQGHARARTGGRVQGHMITSAGRARHEELRAQHVTSQETHGLAPAYDAFLKPNHAFKELTTLWQTAAKGDVSVVLPRLREIHEEVGQVLAAAAAPTPRMAHYQPRFDEALARFGSGDSSALARPMSDSYHDVWMELYEDLLLTLGRARTDEDG